MLLRRRNRQTASDRRQIFEAAATAMSCTFLLSCQDLQSLPELPEYLPGCGFDKNKIVQWMALSWFSWRGQVELGPAG